MLRHRLYPRGRLPQSRRNNHESQKQFHKAADDEENLCAVACGGLAVRSRGPSKDRRYADKLGKGAGDVGAGQFPAFYPGRDAIGQAIEGETHRDDRRGIAHRAQEGGNGGCAGRHPRGSARSPQNGPSKESCSCSSRRYRRRIRRGSLGGYSLLQRGRSRDLHYGVFRHVGGDSGLDLQARPARRPRRRAA